MLRRFGTRIYKMAFSIMSIVGRATPIPFVNTKKVCQSCSPLISNGWRAMAISAPGQGNSDTNLIDDVISFWFGKTSFSRYDTFESKFKLWYGGDKETDDLIRNRFGYHVERALNNELDHLLNHESRPAKGELALTIILDQFPRNIYRCSAKAFSGDLKARGVVLSLLEPDRWQTVTDILPPAVCMSFMLPLMHQESLDDLNLCIDEAGKIAQQLEQEGEQARNCTEKIRGVQAYAKQHRDIIAKYGRYPYRNEVLQRQSTEEEAEFIKYGPRYGQ